MAEPINPIEAVGGPVTDRESRYRYTPGGGVGFGANQIRRRPGADAGLRAGVPADAVELSLDPETIARLPPTVYLRFLVDKASDRVVIQVVNSATDEVIRQVPARELKQALNELQ